MSTYSRLTKHPTKDHWEEAEWRDDYFGHHNYGVYFPTDDKTYDPRAVKMETAEYWCITCKEVYRHECAGEEE